MVLKIADIEKELDRDGDGKISKNEANLLRTLKEADVDGDGEIKVGELLSLAHSMHQQTKANKRLGKMVWGILAMSLLFCGVTFAICLAAVEAAKDSRPSASGIVMSAGSKPLPLANGQAIRIGAIFDLLTTPANELANLKYLIVPSEGVTRTYSIVGNDVHTSGNVTLHTGRGDEIRVSADEFSIYSNGQAIFTQTAEENRRRLMFGGATASGTSTCAFDAG